MLVFRVEKNKVGPYVGDYISSKGNGRKSLDFHSHKNNRPGLSDIKFEDTDDISSFIFGFKSFEQYRRWFHRRFTVLHANGFKLFVYDVHEYDVRFGKHQIVFRALSSLHRKLIGVYNVVGPLPKEVKDLISRKQSCENAENVEKVLLETKTRYAKLVESLSKKLIRSVVKDVKSSPNDCKRHNTPKASQEHIIRSYR